MNRDQFIGFVRSPETLDEGSEVLLERLVKEYPYCQTAEILYALNLNKENNFRFNSQLRLAAAYASDRRLLKLMLDGQKQQIPAAVPASVSPVIAPEKTVPDHQEPAKKTPPEISRPHEVAPGPADSGRKKHLIDLVDRLKQEVESIMQEKEDREDLTLVELASRLEEVIHDHEHPEDTIQPDIKDYNFAHLSEVSGEDDSSMSHEALIDRFIEKEPRISVPPKAGFFDPVDYAKHGLEDKQDVVSETLAKVILKQGYPDRAIKIYERLSLLYPEKSSFFAAQIKKIKDDLLNDH